MQGLEEIFKDEAEEILRELESDIVTLEQNPDRDVLNRIFRYVHTLKGSSGIAGFTGIYEFTHKLENLLDGVRAGTLQIDHRLIDILLGSMDWINNSIFGCIENINLDNIHDSLLRTMQDFKGETADIHAVNNIIEGSQAGAGNLPDLSPDPEKRQNWYYRIRLKFNEDIFESGINPMLIMEDLASLGSLIKIDVDKSGITGFKDFDPEKCYLGWDVVLCSSKTLDKIEDVFLFVKDDNDIDIRDVTSEYIKSDQAKVSLKECKMIGEILVDKSIISQDQLDTALGIQDSSDKKLAEIVVESGYASEEDVKNALNEQEKIKKRIETGTVRVATDRLDKLLNLLGEIIIGQSAISRVADELGGEDGSRVKNAVYEMDRTTRELQEQIMSIRMIPVGPTFEQFKRFVRDTAREHGKEIKIEISGAETELDKTVIERIGDPLKHMIRNAIDHGIELPEERIKAGKSARGIIRIDAYHQEGNVYIEISDDGRGIDVLKVRHKAENMGLIKPGEELTRDKILSYLFMPGFSTSDKVGDLSGRGVGMDVVKTNIDALRGSIDFDSRPGKDTTFRIKLPLTLAIIEGMLVRVGRNIYIIPLLSIVESIRPDRNGVKKVENKGEMVYIRGEYISLVRLYEIFGIEPEFTSPWESLVVIVESDGAYLGIMVDELIGQQQIVIKSLGYNITKSRALSGASILGDGRVSLIIDVHGLVSEMAS